MKVYWLSFCDAARPAGSKFIGACLVKAPGGMPALAVKEAWYQRCNPGGECLLTEIDDDMVPDVIFNRYGNRILARPECDEFEAVLQAHLDAEGAPPAQ